MNHRTTQTTRCKAKPNVIPPSYVTSRLCPATSMLYYSLRPTYDKFTSQSNFQKAFYHSTATSRHVYNVEHFGKA